MTQSAPVGLVPQNLAGRRLGRYEVLCQLAAGGMASVYVARALAVAGFERLVAVKVLHPHLAHEEEFISMFLDEARLAARIRHPNVVPTLDISDSEGDGFFLVMEYIEGHHLGALLQQASKESLRVPPPVVVRCVLDALGGLGAAHDLVDERGRPLRLVHRDVSPHNVMVGTDGISRLTDFGVAKAEVRLSSTRDGQFKGKLAYMAPEHASHGAADQRSDLFAMGIILWEGLTGRRLFRADTNAATLNKILLEPIPLASSVRPELKPFDAVLAKALEREPDQRFQSANDLSEAIENAAAAAGGVGSQRSVGEVTRKLAAEKLAKERERIQQAMDALARSGPAPGAVIPLPMGSGSEPSVPSRSARVPAGAWGAEAQTQTGPTHTGSVGAGAILTPDTLAAHPASPAQSRRSMIVPLAVALFLGLVAIAVGLAFALGGHRDADDVTAPPAIATPVPIPVPMAMPTPPPATPTPPTPPQTPTVPTPPDVAVEAHEPAVPADAAHHHGGHHHHDEASGTGTTPQGTNGGSGDDDLIINPYRH